MNNEPLFDTGFFLGFTAIALLAFAGFMMVKDVFNPPHCVETKQVKDILELRYRTAVISLTDGTTEKVYQATLKPGDNICVKYSR